MSLSWRSMTVSRALVIAATVLAAALFAAVLSAAWLLYLSPGRAADLPGGVPLIKYSDFTDPGSFRAGGPAVMTVTGTANPFLPFNRELHLRVAGPTKQPYNVQLSLPTSASARAGDLLAVRFYLRRPLWSPPARADFVFERAGGDYQKSIVYPVEAGLRWRRVDILFVSSQNYTAGEAHVNFRLGFGPQELELAGLQVVNNGKTAGADFTPEPGYKGREAGAAWREAAERRIEHMRKGEIVVRVADRNGHPVAGARVGIRQLRHAFKFGSAINSKYLYARNREDNKARYRRKFLSLFNSATIENDLKWFFWEGERKGWADRTAAWLKKNDIKLRGHTLVWPGWEHFPRALESLKGDPEKLRAAIRAHITEEVSYYRGRAYEWDVLNEPLDGTGITEMLGPGEPAVWFKYAREADPSAKLFVNEHGIITDLGLDMTRQDRYEAYIRTLIRNGAPLDGIGMQCHFGWDLTPPERLISILDRFQKLGKPIHATELDIDIPDEKLQADYLRDFMTALFSHPAVEGITLWGFWEGVHSEPLPALYRADWTKKPAARVLEDLLLKRWRTEAGGLSDKRGEFSARGFYGEYEITAVSGKDSRVIKAYISAGSGPVTLTLGSP